jgi:hypothetical protein
MKCLQRIYLEKTKESQGVAASGVNTMGNSLPQLSPLDKARPSSDAFSRPLHLYQADGIQHHLTVELLSCLFCISVYKSNFITFSPVVSMVSCFFPYLLCQHDRKLRVVHREFRT